MTSNPCIIDANESVAYAAKMMRDEDVGLAPIVEGEKLIGMLTDRDIAVRVAAEGRDPDQVKVRDVASKRLETIHPQQDLNEALRMMAKHQVRRLPVVEEDGRLVGVVAQADIAREGDDEMTGRLVEEISESGGQMSSFEEGQFSVQPVMPQVEGQQGQQDPQPVIEQQEEPREEEAISRVAATSSRGRKRRTARKKATTSRKKRTTGTRKKRSTSRKKATTSRKRSTGTRARSTARRKTTGRKRSTAKRKTASRKKSTGGARKRKTTGTRKRKTTARKKTTGARKRKTTARKKSTGTRKRKTTARRSTAKRSTAKRSTARRSTGTRRKRRTSRK